MKVRKRPVIIDAEEFVLGKVPRPDGVEAVLVSRQNEHICLGRYTKDTDPNAFDADVAFGVFTSDGWKTIHSGDFVMTGEKGDKRVCTRQVFEEIFEIVSDDGIDGPPFNCDH